MGVYNLDIDEAVILQDSNVFVGKYNVTLILTNRNIIQVNKNVFGGEKNALKYPLLGLKDLNGKPNVRVGKSRDGKTQLELYFQGFEKAYLFQGMLVERKWANAIEKAYKAAAGEVKNAGKAKRNIGGIFAPLKGTIENAKSVLTSNPKEPKILVMKCPKCGAELVGEKGKQIRCSYCEAVITLK